MNTQLKTKRILIYLAFAFGIPWTIALVISLSSMMENNPAQAQGLANTIFISFPWLANVATRLVTKEGWGHLMLRPNFRRGWRFYLAACFLPLLATIVGAALFYLLFPQSFDRNLSQVLKLVEGTASEEWNPWLVWVTVLMTNLVISIPIRAVPALGEEFGWRAYLLPKLVERFSGPEHASDSAEAPELAGGARKATLLIGVIHSVWHWPLIIMAMKFTPEITFLSPLIYFVFSFSLSVLMSWVTLRSGSVWPAAIGHGMLSFYSTMVAAYPLKGQPIPLIGPNSDGLIGGIGFTILALVLFFNRKALAVRKEAGPEKVRVVAGA